MEAGRPRPHSRLSEIVTECRPARPGPRAAATRPGRPPAARRQPGPWLRSARSTPGLSASPPSSCPTTCLSSSAASSSSSTPQARVLVTQRDDLQAGRRHGPVSPGELGGFMVTVTMERLLGSVNVIMALHGAPGTKVRVTPTEVKGSDPGKPIIRLENRLSGLESLRSRSLSEIDQLTAEASHAAMTSPGPSRKPASSPPPGTASSGWRRSSGRRQRPREATAMIGCSQRPYPTQRSRKESTCRCVGVVCPSPGGLGPRGPGSPCPQLAERRVQQY